MTDSTLNRFLSYGTAAERLAFTPDPPTPASGPDPLYLWFETDTTLLWAYSGSWTQITTSGVAGGISFVGVGTVAAAGDPTTGTVFNFSSLVDSSGSMPTVQVNDFAIISWYSHGNGADMTISTPSGWSKLTDLYSNDGIDTNHAVFYKKLTGGDTSVTMPASGNANDAMAAVIMIFRGVDTVTPFDVSETTATGQDTSRPDPPSITPSTTGAWIVIACGSGAADSNVYTNPGDLSSTTNHFKAVHSNDTNQGLAGIGIKTDWTSGAFNPSAWTGSTVNAVLSWAAVSMVLKPA